MGVEKASHRQRHKGIAASGHLGLQSAGITQFPLAGR
jgi:hypothetical protein